MRGPDGRFLKGPGRTKGSKNVVSSTMKAALSGSFDEVGGQDYLVKLANGNEKDRAAYCQLLGKLLPSELKAELSGDGVPLLIFRDYTGRHPQDHLGGDHGGESGDEQEEHEEEARPEASPDP